MLCGFDYSRFIGRFSFRRRIAPVNGFTVRFPSPDRNTLRYCRGGRSRPGRRCRQRKRACSEGLAAAMITLRVRYSAGRLPASPGGNAPPRRRADDAVFLKIDPACAVVSPLTVCHPLSPRAGSFPCRRSVFPHSARRARGMARSRRRPRPRAWLAERLGPLGPAEAGRRSCVSDRRACMDGVLSSSRIRMIKAATCDPKGRFGRSECELSGPGFRNRMILCSE